MRILLIDNYDSFTWNLHHLIVDAGIPDITIVENDKVEDEMLESTDAIVFSPGPGLPAEAGQMKAVIRKFAGRKKMLGICLGHQAIAEVFGARLILADEIFHGTSASLIVHERDTVFKDLYGEILVGRYHSWIVSPESLPGELIVTATDEKGVIMALRHKCFDITGLQFHPESILTPLGTKMLQNWLSG